jgi:hypothetical protein
VQLPAFAVPCKTGVFYFDCLILQRKAGLEDRFARLVVSLRYYNISISGWHLARLYISSSELSFALCMADSLESWHK